MILPYSQRSQFSVLKRDSVFLPVLIYRLASLYTCHHKGMCRLITFHISVCRNLTFCNRNNERNKTLKVTSYHYFIIDLTPAKLPTQKVKGKKRERKLSIFSHTMSVLWVGSFTADCPRSIVPPGLLRSSNGNQLVLLSEIFNRPRPIIKDNHQPTRTNELILRITVTEKKFAPGTRVSHALLSSTDLDRVCRSHQPTQTMSVAIRYVTLVHLKLLA